MGKRKRDYAAEYKRRIARGKAKGLPRHVAAGHPHSGELGIRAAAFLGKTPGFRVKVKPGSRRSIKAAVKRDALYAFGEVPKRSVADHDDVSSAAYQLRLETLAARPSLFNWQNEREFINQMMALGLTENQAYSHWFSPGGASV